MNKSVNFKCAPKEIIEYGIFAVFVLITFCLLFSRQPFFDEAHAWMISKTFGFFELFKIEKFEGHLFLWHTILSPFSKNNFFYPYSMYIINWLFCVLAVFVFLKNAPFSLIEKGLIVFSYPVLWYFAPVARCYSIGLLFLFLILSIWNKRLKHPVLISILLILFSNTSAMALIGSLPLTLIFSYDLIKSKSKNITPFIILFFGFFLVYIQLFGAAHPDVKIMVSQNIYLLKLIVYFFLFDFSNGVNFFYLLNKITAVAILFLYGLSVFYFQKSKRAGFFLLTTVILMNLLFIFKYTGAWWHYLFFFIYFIVSIWLLRLENPIINPKMNKIFNFLFKFILVSFCLTSIFFKVSFKDEIYASRSFDIAKVIKNENLFNDSKIYALDTFTQTSIGILPYFNDLKIYNILGYEKYTKEEYENLNNHFSKTKTVDMLAKSLDDKKRNTGITNRHMFPFYEGEKYNVLLTPVYQNADLNFIIYDIKRVEK